MWLAFSLNAGRLVSFYLCVEGLSAAVNQPREPPVSLMHTRFFLVAHVTRVSTMQPSEISEKFLKQLTPPDYNRMKSSAGNDIIFT